MNDATIKAHRSEIEHRIYVHLNERRSFACRHAVDCGPLGTAVVRWNGLRWDLLWIEPENCITIDAIGCTT